MDVLVTKFGQRFVWDSEKAASNEMKHGITFDRACEVFFDIFVRFVDASVDEEARDAAIGFDAKHALLFVVHVEREMSGIRIISARPATAVERKDYENYA